MILTCLWPSAQCWSFHASSLLTNRFGWSYYLIGRVYFAVDLNLQQLSAVMAGRGDGCPCCAALLFIIIIFNPDGLSVWSICFSILRETASLKKVKMAEMNVRLRAAGRVLRLMATLKGTCCQDLRSQSSIHQDPEWRPDSSFSLREIISNDVMTTALYSLGMRTRTQHLYYVQLSTKVSLRDFVNEDGATSANHQMHHIAPCWLRPVSPLQGSVQSALHWVWFFLLCFINLLSFLVNQQIKYVLQQLLTRSTLLSHLNRVSSQI